MATIISGTSITFNDATTQTTTGTEFVTGTLMLFQQTAAPTGWTKQTTHNDKALRVVSGTASSGGTSGFSAVFTSTLSVDATTLNTTQIPSHTHTYNAATPASGAGGTGGTGGYIAGATSGTSGGGGSHTHTVPLAVQYVDLIIASKN